MNMTYAYAPRHMLGMTRAYPSLGILSGIEIEGDLKFLNQYRRSRDMHCGPSNIQTLHHHPFDSYGPVIRNVLNFRILPPIQLHPTPTTNTIHLSQIMADERGNMRRSFLQTLYYLTRITLRQDRYPLSASLPMPMGYWKRRTAGCQNWVVMIGSTYVPPTLATIQSCEGRFSTDAFLSSSETSLG